MQWMAFVRLVAVCLCISVFPVLSLSCSENPNDPVTDGDLEAEQREAEDSERTGDEYAALELSESLNATFDDPILLTMAAEKSRSHYFVDEGYTLTRDESGIVSFVTDTAGDFGLALMVDGVPILSDSEMFSPVSIQAVTSDAVVLTYQPVEDLVVELRFAVLSSRVAAMEVWLRNQGNVAYSVVVQPWLRRCELGYSKVANHSTGLSLNHHVEIGVEEKMFGAGTFVEDLAGRLVIDQDEFSVKVVESCGDSLLSDLTSTNSKQSYPGQAAFVALTSHLDLPAKSDRVVRTYRAVVDSEKAASLEDELQLARQLSISEIILQGDQRLQSMLQAAPLSLNREDALLYRSCFTLLDQLRLPAEGNLAHDYYLFSREPTWWFGRLGQHIHESMAMILMARLNADFAMESQRVFIDRVEADGYLPYNIGPVLEQTAMRTASAPLFNFVSWEMAQIINDRQFLQDSYDAGVLLHGFWVRERDKDQDGLCEWGGYGLTESVRDLENVIWEQVAAPENLEAIGLNTMLVKEEQSLAAMAQALGLTDEATQWQQAAQARADLINATMWDEQTGFYYHVTMVDNDFSYASENDLKRMEIAGFLPLWAGIVPEDRKPDLLNTLTDTARFWRPNGVAGLSAEDTYYDPAASQCCRWRGPVWVQWQWMLFRALVDMGETERARELAEKVISAVRVQLAKEHQFRELYDADDIDAENHSMSNYIWTALTGQLMLEADQL